MKQTKRPLKLSKTGLEVELHLIDEDGKIANKGMQLISKVKKKNPNIDIVKEIGKNMIEFGCYPGVETHNPFLDMISSVEESYNIARKEGLYFYPFSTYPGRFESKLNKFSNYKVKEKIFGTNKIENATKAVGFHHHYSLPKGVFDENSKTVKFLKNSKLMRSMISSYNFEIAADPALTLLMQSSPLCEGEHIAKDMRLLIYRGGRKLRYPEGLYSKLQQFGALPPYKFTATDLLESFKRRVQRWRTKVKKANPNADFDKIYQYKLDISWNPVKINKHGTLEQRGMDMNMFSIILPVTLILKSCLEEIQRQFIEVIPADFAIDKPFKMENGILYVPPHTYVRNKLQYLSAYKGYESREAQEYVKSLLKLSKHLIPKKYSLLINRLFDMAETKKSMSDKILNYARYKGYLNDNKINQSDSADLALYYAKMFEKDLLDTKAIVEQLAYE